jgi:6-phosphogluconolactonase
MLKIQIYDNEDQLFRSATALFLTLTEFAAHNKDKIYMALSGGGTPKEFYANLVQKKEQFPWHLMEIYFSDERLVPLDDEGSNYYQASTHLLDLVGHPVAQRHSPDVTLSMEEASKEYESDILEQVPLREGVPSFDIVFLGLGDDGHTASLFPHRIGEEIFQYLIIPAEAKYQGRPSLRVSMTPKLINYASNVIFMLSGYAKAQAVYHTLMEPQDWRIWPACSITGDKNNVYWLMDKEAAEYFENAADNKEK